MILAATLPGPHYRRDRRRPRLGATDATTQIVGSGSQIASAGLAATQAAASAGLITLGTTAAAAIPVAGAVIAVGVLIYGLLHNSRGLQQNVETTAAVNKGMALMFQNLQAWQASDKSCATQAQALANFDQCWAAITNFCGQASEGKPGERCISERQRGGKYDYFAAYRDPIANDTCVNPAAASLASALSPLASTDWTGYAIPAALIIAALFLK